MTPNWTEYPSLAEAAREAGASPVLVGDEVKSPSGISIYWIEEQLRLLEVEPFAVAAAREGAERHGFV